MSELQAELQRLSGTKLDAQGAANAWAGTTGLDLVGALNAKAGTTGRDLLGAIRAIAEGAETLRGHVGTPVAVNTLSLPGTSGNYVSTPDSVANSVASDIDIRMWIAPTSWTANKWVFSKYGNAGQRAWALVILAGGALQLNISADGTAVTSSQSSVATGFTDGTAHWVQVTWRNSDNRLQFFTSEDGAVWTQLGIDTTLGATGIFNNTSPVEIGSAIGGTLLPFAGKVYKAELRDGIGGTLVHSFDATTVTPAGTRNPSTVAAGGPWTINGTAWNWATV